MSFRRRLKLSIFIHYIGFHLRLHILEGNAEVRGDKPRLTKRAEAKLWQKTKTKRTGERSYDSCLVLVWTPSNI